MSKHFRFGLVMVAVVMSSYACKKQPLPNLPQGNSPIYTLSGLVGTDSINMRVGMETVTINHGFSEENGVSTYYGEMDYAAENEKFRIDIIRNEKTQGDGGVSVFKEGEIPFLVHQKGRFKFDFGGVGNQNNYLLLQDKNGNFVNTDELEINEFGIYEVRAKFSDLGNDVFDFEVKHGYEERELNSMYLAQGSDDTIVLESIFESNYHEWYIDGLLVGTDTRYEGGISDGVHRIRHRVIDGFGNESSSKSLVRFKGGKEFWDMKINYVTEPTFETYNFGRVIISMFKNGKWYTSTQAVSNQTKTFNVSDINFIPNEGGQHGLTAFRFNFNAVLYNQNASDSLVLSNLSGEFIVGTE